MTIAELRELLERASVRVQEAAAEIEQADEDADLDALNAELDAAVADAERCRANLEAAERAERARAAFPMPAARQSSSSSSVVITVGREEPTYRPDLPGISFFSDAYRAQFHADQAARERLERNSREQAVVLRERGVQMRDVGTSAFAGLTVPQYLIDLYAPLARAGAPLLSAVRKLPLPPAGMTISISRITTGSGVAAQANETDAVQETNMDDTKLDVNVRTYAGMQDVSRQALERSDMVDAVVFQDLIADYFTKLDHAIINGDGTAGSHLGIRSTSGIITVTYTDSSPTVPELYPKVADAIQQIASNRYAPALACVMHPRRWGWATAALDSSNRPLVVPSAQGPYNALAVGDAPEYGAVVGTMQGLPVITDANVPTNLGAGSNEDLILVLRTTDLLFWQDGDGSPRQMRFEQSNAPQSIRLAVFGYSAFTAGRYPAACATIGGTGLVTPTF